MADSKKTKKTKKTPETPKTPAHPSASSAFPTLPEGVADLSGLCAALGAPDEAARKLLFRNHDEADFFEWGVSALSDDIVADMPRLLSSALRILASLGDKQRARIKLPAAIFAVIADETAKLDTMKNAHAEVTDAEDAAFRQREVALKKASSNAIAERNEALAGLTQALGAKRVADVKKAASDASTPDALVKGIKKVVSLITTTLKEGSSQDKAALAMWGVEHACATALQTTADEVTALSKKAAKTARRVSQRELDIQDGRVLVLADAVLRAFRLARRRDRSILMPELNRLASLFDTQSRGGDEAAVAPVPAAPGAEKAPS